MIVVPVNYQLPRVAEVEDWARNPNLVSLWGRFVISMGGDRTQIVSGQAQCRVPGR